MSDIQLTIHSVNRSNERLNTHKKELAKQFEVARKKGLWNAGIPKVSKYNFLHKALKSNKVYFNGVIYVTQVDNHKKLLTCYKAGADIKKAADEILAIINKPKDPVKSGDGHIYVRLNNLGLAFKLEATNFKIKSVELCDWEEAADDTSKSTFLCQCKGRFKNSVNRAENFPYPVDYTGIPELNAKIYARVKMLAPGKTMTYKELAAEFGITPQKCSRILNDCPFIIVVPTHRVISTRHRLGSYRYEYQAKTRADWNNNLKAILLKNEINI